MPAKNNVVLSFSDGEDIFSEVINLMKSQGEDYFQFLGAKGEIKDFTVLSSGQSASLNSMSFPDAFNVVSVSGKVEKRNGQLVPTVYVSLSRNGFGTLSGQLVKAKASEGLELSVRKVNVKGIILG